MWKLLYQMASPRSFFYRSQACLPWLGGFALLFLLISSVWGLWWAPADYQQGDAFRIIYVHVPAAFMSLALYGGMTACALLFLVWRIKLAGLMLSIIAEIGAWMTFLALMTGSIWGKPMWGTWWVWDARLTSELILLLLYLAILVLSYAFARHHQQDKLLAILTLVGAIDLPIIHYSVFWWNSLHQGETLSLFAKPKIASSMLYPLLGMLIGCMLYCLWIILHKASHRVLMREKKQQWVKSLIEGGY